MRRQKFGAKTEIRTQGQVTLSTVFKTASLNHSDILAHNLAPSIGFEPMTYRLEGGCSIPTELIGHMGNKLAWSRTAKSAPHVERYNLLSCIATVYLHIPHLLGRDYS